MDRRESRRLIKALLSEIFNAIKDYNGGLVYSFKGGFILSNYLSPDGARETKDIDLSIGNVSDFYIITDIVSGILDKWKTRGVIYSYKIKKPVEGVSSGGIDIYRKIDPNLKAFVWTGLDISVHDMNFGIIKIRDFNCYSIERMLIDKVSVMYANEITLLRRSRDMYDIYLLNLLNYSLNGKIIDASIKDRNLNINKESTFEKLLMTDDGKEKLINGIIITLRDRASKDWISKCNITSSDILRSVEYVLWLLRKGDM